MRDSTRHIENLGILQATSKAPDFQRGDWGITATIDGKEYVIGEAWAYGANENGDRARVMPAEANARLWAASPKLLAACRRIAEALSVHHMGGREPFPGDERYAEAHQGLYDAIAAATEERIES